MRTQGREEVTYSVLVLDFKGHTQFSRQRRGKDIPGRRNRPYDGLEG